MNLCMILNHIIESKIPEKLIENPHIYFEIIKSILLNSIQLIIQSQKMMNWFIQAIYGQKVNNVPDQISQSIQQTSVVVEPQKETLKKEDTVKSKESTITQMINMKVLELKIKEEMKIKKNLEDYNKCGKLYIKKMTEELPMESLVEYFVNEDGSIKDKINVYTSSRTNDKLWWSSIVINNVKETCYKFNPNYENFKNVNEDISKNIKNYWEKKGLQTELKMNGWDAPSIIFKQIK